MNRYIKFVFILAVFSIAFLGMAGDLHAAKLSDYGLKEGDLVSALFSDDPDVYIINEQGYKRLFLNAEIFNFYGHLGGFFNVKLVSPEVRDTFPTSGLFRNCEDNDPRVFGVNIEGEDIGKLRWLDASATSTLSEDPAFFNKVFCINRKEFNWYPKGLHLKALKDLPKYERKLAKKIEKIVNKIKEHKDDDDYFKKEIKSVGKIVICHKGKETITIGLPALQAHIKHGDEIGKCGAPTPTPGDTTAPVISGASATNTTYNSTHIVWITNENANDKVWYSTSTPVVATSSTPSVSSATLITSHDMTLTGLSASTTYYYLIQSSDASGNIGTSTEQSFTTLSVPPDTTAPVISGVSATSTATTTASVTWTTNENSDSKVWYAATTPISATGSTPTVSSPILVKSHDLTIAGLSASTTYYYLVQSNDASGNIGTSTEQSFTTLPVPADITAPVISGVSATSTATTTASVTWTTDEPADSTVWYATSTPVSTATASSTSSAALVTGHSIDLSELSASTLYYYFVGSKDSALNTATSTESSFTTLAP